MDNDKTVFFVLDNGLALVLSAWINIMPYNLEMEKD